MATDELPPSSQESPKGASERLEVREKVRKASRRRLRWAALGVVLALLGVTARWWLNRAPLQPGGPELAPANLRFVMGAQGVTTMATDELPPSSLGISQRGEREAGSAGKSPEGLPEKVAVGGSGSRARSSGGDCQMVAQPGSTPTRRSGIGAASHTGRKRGWERPTCASLWAH